MIDVKVFQIGFSKCATSSIHDRFLRLGLNSAHNEGGKLACRLKENLESGQYILSGIDEYDAYTDLHYIDGEVEIEGYKYFDVICEQVENSIFVLNTRNMDDWIESCRNHLGLFDGLSSVHGIDEHGIEELLKERWVQHHEKVLDRVPANRLLIFDIDKDDARKIDRFLGASKALSPTLSLVNKTEGEGFKLLYRRTPRLVYAWMPKSFRASIRERLKALL